METIATYSDKEFLRHFRVNRDVVNEIVERFKNSKQFTYQSGNYGKLTPLKFVLAFLWFAGHQTASFRDIAKRFRITTSSLFRVITRISEFLNDLSSEFIKWPSAEELHDIEKNFRHEQSFPGAVGVVDVQQIITSKIVRKTTSPLQKKGPNFFQLQIVCDHRRKLLDIFAERVDSIDGRKIFEDSPLSSSLPEKCKETFIIGSSTYPCSQHLLTPFKNIHQLNSIEKNFNEKITQNRKLTQNCFAMLKQRFPQLCHVRLRNIDTIVNFIRACCVLHNIALGDNFVFIEENKNKIAASPKYYDDEDDDVVEFRKSIAYMLKVA
ncbi:hypothetical protein MML48_5g00003283 [Holotrichia oblita]|uniref:Uncharacterized protein n=2 Tax=Holotrichia oblita TaxID=644536 RepID=A0ACB9T675_HOLOL|nr:hypothetical protein MML48_5g00011113 [Holotrichia oblita]KAI4462214.1 hypothetical protein MML48_5g00003283 [Holotrichia oblita]